MCKVFILQIIILLSSLTLRAQHKQGFELDTPQIKIKNSLYNSIKLIDLRNDTASMGFVQTGLMNRRAIVVPNKPLARQLSGLITAITDSSARHNELLLQLRQFAFAEVTGSFSEKGYCYVKAQLYANNADKYQLVGAIDTILLVKAMDVTGGILKAGSAIMGTFIADNLLKQASGVETYTRHEILNIDSVEKSKLKLYTTTTYTDGVYATYKSFSNQAPDKQIVLEGYELYPDAVKAKDENGKLKKVQLSKIYAIVYQGKPYMATQYQYCPLKKVGTDFIFTGNVKVAASAAEQVTAGLLLGMIGSMMVSNAEATYEMKIDHKDGTFIRLREIQEAPKPQYNEE